MKIYCMDGAEVFLFHYFRINLQDRYFCILPHEGKIWTHPDTADGQF